MSEETNITETTANPQWECVSHCPTEWALGTPQGNEIHNILAMVTRREDGKWSWRTFIPECSGVEPSRETAMLGAAKLLPSLC